MKKHKHYIEIERKIINLMLRYPSIVAEMKDQGLVANFFDTTHRDLVRSIYYIYRDSGGKHLLTEESYKNLLLGQGIKGDISIALQVYHECLYGVHHSNVKDDFGLLKRQLIDSFVHREGVEAFQTFQNNVSKMGYLESMRKYVDDLSSLINFTTIDQPDFVMLDGLKDKYYKSLEERRSNPEKVLRCNIPEINDAMNVGFKAGHTTLVVGATGGHKSNLMINLSLQLHLNGANVLFLPLEMDWEDFTSRVISNVTEVSYKKLLDPKLLTEEELKKVSQAETWVSNNNKFAILDVVGERISIPGLKRELEKRLNYFIPDILVVDYLGLLKLDTSFAGRHDLALGELTKSLKFLGKKYGFHIMTAAQMGRADIKRLREEGTGVQLDSTAVRGSQEVSSDVEFIFAMTAVPDEPDRLKLHVIKSRYGPSGHTKELQLNANICKIASTSWQIPGIKNEATDDEWESVMNQPVEEAIKELKNIQFQSLDTDSEDWETV